MIISNQDSCNDSQSYFKIQQSLTTMHNVYQFRNEKAKHIDPQNFNLQQHLQSFQYDLLSNKIYWNDSCFYPKVSIKKIEVNENYQIGNIKLFFLNFSFELNFLNRHRDFCEQQQNQKKDYFVCTDQPSSKNTQNSTFSKIKINRIFFQKNIQQIDDRTYSGLFKALQTVCISKLLSILKLGPKFQQTAGFDFLLYQRALAFFQEDCHNIIGQQGSLNKQIMVWDLEFIQMLGINQNRFDRSLIGFSHAHKKYVFCQIKNKFHIKQRQQKNYRKILICKKLNDCFQLITNEIIFDRSAEQQKFYRQYLVKYQKEIQYKSRQQNMQKKLTMSNVPLIFNLFKAKYLLFKEEKQTAKNLYKTIHRQLTQNMFITKNIQKMSPKRENWMSTIRSQLSKTQEGVDEQFYMKRMNLITSLTDKKIMGEGLRDDLKNQILQRLLNFRHSQRNSQQFTIFFQHLIFLHHFNIDENQLEFLMVNCMSKINSKIHISTHWQNKESIILEFCAKALEIYYLIDKNDCIISTTPVSKEDKQHYLYYLLIICQCVCQFNISMEIVLILRKKIEISTQIRKYINLQIIYSNLVMVRRQNWSILDDQQLDLIANNIKDTSIQSLCMVKILRSLKNSQLYKPKLLQLVILDQNQLLKQFQELINKQKGKDNWLLIKYTGFLYLKRFMLYLSNTRKDENYTISRKIAKQMKQLIVNDDQNNASFQHNTIQNTIKNGENQLNTQNFLSQFVDKKEQFNKRIDLMKFINKRIFKFNIFRMKPYNNLYYYVHIFQYISEKNIAQKQSLIQKSQQAAKTNNQKLINFQKLIYILQHKQTSKQNLMLYETNECFSKVKKILLQQLENSKEEISFPIHQRVLECINPSKHQQFYIEYTELFFKNVKCDSKNFHLMFIAYILRQDNILEKIKFTNQSIDLTIWQEAITIFQESIRQQQLQNVENFIDCIIKKQDVIPQLRTTKGINYFNEILTRQDFYHQIYTDFIKIAQYLNHNQIMISKNSLMYWVLIFVQKLAYSQHFQNFFKIFISTQFIRPNIFIAMIGSILLSYFEKRSNFLHQCQKQAKKSASQIIMEGYYKINLSLQNRLNQSHIVALINLILKNLQYPTHSFRNKQVKYFFKTYKIYYYMSEYFYSKRFYYLLKHLHCGEIVTSKQFKELKQQVQMKVKNKKNSHLGKAVLKKINKMKKNCIPTSI